MWVAAVTASLAAAAASSALGRKADEKAKVPPARPWAAARSHGHVEDIPLGLLEALRRGRCVAMVGAGLSYPAGLPGYEALLQGVASDAGVEVELPEGSGSYDDLDRVQFRLAEQIGKDRMCRIMRSRLYLAEPFPDAMQVVLERFCRVPFAAVISWNWDNILDARYDPAPNNASGFGEVARAVAHRESYTTARVPLLKMQGDLDDVGSAVVTASDYDRREPRATEFLHRLHETHTVLYVGMSLRAGGVGDQRRPGSGHYAIVNDVDPERREQLERWNIHAIGYDSAATAWKGNELILEELARRCDPRFES